MHKIGGKKNPTRKCLMKLQLRLDYAVWGKKGSANQNIWNVIRTVFNLTWLTSESESLGLKWLLHFLGPWPWAACLTSLSCEKEMLLFLISPPAAAAARTPWVAKDTFKLSTFRGLSWGWEGQRHVSTGLSSQQTLDFTSHSLPMPLK